MTIDELPVIILNIVTENDFISNQLMQYRAFVIGDTIAKIISN